MQSLELQYRINYLTSYPLEPVEKPVTPNSCLYSDPRLVTLDELHCTENVVS